MAARLGNVLYWLGCSIAGLTALALVFVAMNPGEDFWYYVPIYFWIAVGAWLIGRACRYILAGT